MQGLVSLLPYPETQRVEALWNELEANFGLKYIRLTPFPHFTWHLAEAYQDREIIPMLDEFTRKQQPFHVLINGVDSFKGESPVVFLKVEQKPVLNCVHERLWQMFAPLVTEPNALYAPGTWHPHVTLALQDLDWDTYPEVMRFLGTKELTWRIVVDNITMLCQEGDDQAFIQNRFVFGRGLADNHPC